MKKIILNLKRVKSPDLLAGLALFFTSLLFFTDLFTDRYLLTERDLAPYFIPPRFLWVESLKQGDFPLWNPYQFTGHPFFANPQHGMFYPLNILFFIFPFDFAFNAVIIFHFFLGGLFTYLFVRDLRTGFTGALISGLIFMLGGYLLSVHSLLTTLLSVVWTPLMMMFFRRAMTAPGIKNEILTAFFITLSFLGGGIEVVYGNFFVLLIMMVISILSNHSRLEKKFQYLFLTIRSSLIVSFSFLFLSAIQLLPFLELWRHSIRGGGLSYQEATIWSFAPKDFLLFFLPDAYGYFLDMKKYWVTQCWLKTMYTGGLPFILSGLFFFSSRIVGKPLSGLPQNGRPLRVAPTIIERNGFRAGKDLFLALMIFSLFLSLGQYNPLYSLVYKYIPFFNGIRYPVKFLYIFILCLAITAGLGFERFRQFSKERRARVFKHLLMIFSFLSGLMLLALILGHGQVEYFLKARGVDFPDFNHLSTNLYHAKRFFFYLTLFFLLLRVGYEVGWKGWIMGLLVFFLIADLFGNMGFYGKEKSDDYFKQTKISEIIASDRKPFRTFSTAKTISLDTPILIGNAVPFDLIKEKHLPSLNMIFRVHDIYGIDVVRLKRGDELYKVFTNAPSISATNLVNVYGIKYVISVTPIEEDPRFELVYARLEGLEGNQEDLLKENTIKLYRNKNPLSRAWLVGEFKVMDSKEMLLTMMGKDFRPDREVLLEEAPPSLTLPIDGRGKGGGEVEFLSESNNKLSLKVEAERESILVLSDTYYPGWKVFVNGKEEKILRANYNFRAVPLSRGVHQVEFVYAPLSFKLGAAITFIGILGCLSGWMIRRNFRSL